MPQNSIRLFIVALSGLLSAIALNSCAGHRLLTAEPPVASSTSGNEENHTLLFERLYRHSPSGSLTSRTHTLVRVGSHGTEEELDVVDASMEKLAAFEARVIHADGSIEWYDKGDLSHYALSSARMIAERSLKFVGLKKVPHPGDLIEVAYEHDLALPQLGTLFTIRESGPSADVVKCTFEVPIPDTLLYSVLNGSLLPLVVRNGNTTAYTFTWAPPPHKEERSVFSKSNDAPGVIAIDPARGPGSWKAFGDWYLELIENRLPPDDRITAEAKRITRPEMSDLEKMNAIAAFCQSSVRYEQVYLARGEFIPNRAPAVLAKRYGDCKDYSCLMVSMARAIGLDAHLALCYRGRGFQLCEALPVSQFNHMIAHVTSGGRDFWYDGTNLSGTPGVTAGDLVNARALIIEKGNSRLSSIPESEENLLSVVGTLHPEGSSLSGKFTMRLAGQYAVGFLFAAKYLNEGADKSFLVKWLKETLTDRLTVTTLVASSSGGAYEIEVTCEIPNSLVQIDATTYIQFDKIFNRLLPAEEPGRLGESPYIFPGYARVAMDVTIPALKLEGAKDQFRWEVKYALPPGPFSAETRGAFVDELRQIRQRFAKTFTLSRKE